MYRWFIRYSLLLCLVNTLFLVAGCSSTQAPDSPTAEVPVWISTPPVDAGFIYGIGVDPDPEKAKQKAIVNVGQQFVSRISATVEDQQLASRRDVKRIVNTVNEQLTRTEVSGAKFADHYLDGRGRTWILTQAPLDCVLDVSEGILLSYVLRETDREEIQQRVVRAVEGVATSLERTGDTYFEGRADGIVQVAPGTIDIDGDISDWIIPPIAVDNLNDESAGNRDISKVYLASDDTYLYVRVDFREGRPRATSSDFTYDITFTLGADHYELWCLKNNIGPAVNIGNRTSTGGAIWRQQEQGCRTRSGDGYLEARFPWENIASNPADPQQIYAKFRVRDAGSDFDVVDLPPLEM